jgi:type I restriction enzyme M protein
MATAIKSKEEIVLEDNELVCILSGEVKKVKARESNLQSVILMLNEEYGFDLDDMERDFTVEYEDLDCLV